MKTIPVTIFSTTVINSRKSALDSRTVSEVNWKLVTMAICTLIDYSLGHGAHTEFLSSIPSFWLIVV